MEKVVRSEPFSIASASLGQTRSLSQISSQYFKHYDLYAERKFTWKTNNSETIGIKKEMGPSEALLGVTCVRTNLIWAFTTSNVGYNNMLSRKNKYICFRSVISTICSSDRQIDL